MAAALLLLPFLTVAQGIKLTTVGGQDHAGRVRLLTNETLILTPFGTEDSVSFNVRDVVELFPAREEAAPLSSSSKLKAKFRQGYHQVTLGYWRESEDPGLTLAGNEIDTSPERFFYVPPSGSLAGKYFKGTTPPPGTLQAWTRLDYDDSTWENGKLPLGYGENSVQFATDLPDMRNNYRGVFLRLYFTVDNPAALGGAELRGRADDGYIAWINGHEVDRYNMPNGDLTFDVHAERSPEPIPLIQRPLPPPTSYLVKGTNVLAFHAANVSRSSSDLLVDLALVLTQEGGVDESGFRRPENPSPLAPGWAYTTYNEAYQVRTVADLVKATSGETGTTPDFHSIIAKLPANSGAVFTGYFHVPADGEFELNLNSKGYSRLMLGNPITTAAADPSPSPPPPDSGNNTNTSPATPLWAVRLQNGTTLAGDISHWTETHLTFQAELPSPSPAFRIPVDQIGELRRADANLDATRSERPDQDSDVVVVAVEDDKTQRVAGLVRGIDNEALLFRFRDRDRRINLDKVRLIQLSRDHSPTSPLHQFHQTAFFKNGQALPGIWSGASANGFNWKSFWGPELKFAWRDLQSIRSVNGRLQYLADLAPAEVVQVPFFDRVMPYRVRASLTGTEIRFHPPLSNEAYLHSISVHSRTALAYQLNRNYDRFLTGFAFQYPEGTLGHVDIRIWGDRKVLFEQKDFQGSDPIRHVDLSVAGVSLLTLEVDFGKNQDVGDHLVWADPRLIKPPAQ